MEQKGLSVKRKKLALTAVIAIAVVMVFSAVVYARYIRNSNEVENKLSPKASVMPGINEVFENNIKKDVSISVGDTDYPVYVRAAVVFTWKLEKQTDEDNGFLYFKKPESGTDYELKLAENNNWFYSDPASKGDGYYYYKKPVASGGTTDILIEECTQKRTMTDEQGNTYTLNVEIITQTVQAVGHTDDGKFMSVEDAWKWKPDTKTENNNNNT